MSGNMDPYRAYVPAHVGQGGGHMPAVGQNAVRVFSRMFRCTSLQSTGRVRVAALPAFFTSFHSSPMTVEDTLRAVAPAVLSVPIQTAGHTVEPGRALVARNVLPTHFRSSQRGSADAETMSPVTLDRGQQ